MGNNSFGQCGAPIIEGQIFSASHIVNQVELPEKVIDIVCGQDHTFFLTNNGSLYSCGLSTDGQTGLGHFDCVGIPQKVGGDLSGEENPLGLSLRGLKYKEEGRGLVSLVEA